jgi:GT2 family glycosyltransferase
MTGALLSFLSNSSDLNTRSIKRNDIEMFSEYLSKYTQFDFSRIADNYRDEISGLLTYMKSRRIELESEGLSKSEILVYLTLNMISSFSLWLGFNNVVDQPKSQSRANNNSAQPSTSLIQRHVTQGNNKLCVVIPTNISNQDKGRLLKLNRLVKSLIQWDNLLRIWIIGRIPDRALSVLGKFEKVETINLEEDKGPAKARNIGIERALESDMELIVFMDGDVVSPDKNAFESVFNRAIRDGGIYFPKVESYYRTCFDLFHDLDGTLNGVYEPDSNLNSLLYGTTCVMIAPTSIFCRGLKFDEDFPLAAGEDIDFCIRARANGVKVLPADDLIVKHDYGYRGRNNPLAKFVSRFARYGEGNRLIKSRSSEYFHILTNSIRRSTHYPKKKVTGTPTSVRLLSKIVERCLE